MYSSTGTTFAIGSPLIGTLARTVTAHTPGGNPAVLPCRTSRAVPHPGEQPFPGGEHTTSTAWRPVRRVSA
ncbi:hypothetical protein ACFPM0_03885 [Pseudonocardia sulfidoxydans]|uniref:hypothetical protein n=1 Tax=Pseudonocardia sulfidoxydans TaxID=54011 RepID=UPI0036170182